MELAVDSPERIVRAALAEDGVTGDLTSEGVLSADAFCSARLLLKEPGVVCGLDVAALVFHTVDPEMRFEALVADGDRCDDSPTAIALVEGPARAVMAGERTALNLVGRLSGVATLTRRFVDAVEGTGVAILDTRKTTPGLRMLEKYAVRCGGGRNHRYGLDDGILVKDNHLRLVGGIRTAIERIRVASPDLPVEVEAETLADVREALACGAERILLDNMPTATMAEAVELVGGRAGLEASGGVSLESVRAIAETGVDFISVGALTHSARSLDVSLDVLEVP